MNSPTVTRHVLPGLHPEPLASYLAGLGLIRVLGEQGDTDSSAAWTPDGLSITTRVQDLAEWLANDYKPMPVMSPWNGGSGFGAKDKEPLRRLRTLRASSSSRLAGLRSAIEVADDVVRKARAEGWITDSGVAEKDRVVLEFRNRCPDDLLPWIDAAIVLADDDTFFPPLLGTGGNDGRLEFSTNFHQQLIDLVDTSDKDRARPLAAARDLLAGTQDVPLSDVPIGQFDPGSAGGPGSSRFGAAASLANPWCYVLVVEGSVLFAASAARKNQHAAGRAAMPFTVNPSPDGSVSGADGEESRGEVWVPVWREDFTLPEIKQLFAEARASWRGRPARRAVDFYAATHSLGVARGINEFVRYGLQRRNGLAFAAVALDRIVVEEKPAVQLAAKIEDWAARVSGGEASSAVAEASRRFQKAHVVFASNGNPHDLVQMLAALTSLEVAVGRSGRAREAIPVRIAPAASGFLSYLNELASPELRIAVGIASCATRPAQGPGRTMRQILLPVDPGAGWRDAPIVPGFDARPLTDVLADVLVWRSRTAPAEHNAAKYRGVSAFPSGIPVPAADLHDFASDRLDEATLSLYLRACLALNWWNVKPAWTAAKPQVPVTTLALLHPFASGLRQGNHRDGPEDDPVPALAAEWAVRLASRQPGQVQRVHDEAAARLREAGSWTAVTAPPDGLTPDGIRLAAALVPRCLAPIPVLRMAAFETATDTTPEDENTSPQPELLEEQQ